MDMRIIRPKNGHLYLRLEDVVEFLLEIAASEETDVRWRIEQAAENIRKLEKGA
jgi:hypothetical protein